LGAHEAWKTDPERHLHEVYGGIYSLALCSNYKHILGELGQNRGNKGFQRPNAMNSSTIPIFPNFLEVVANNWKVGKDNSCFQKSRKTQGKT
jgi:hypothetical protein